MLRILRSRPPEREPGATPPPAGPLPAPLTGNPAVDNIAGLDPAIVKSGWCGPNGHTLLIRPNTGPEDPARRLHELRTGLRRAIRLTAPRPDLVVIEGYALGAGSRHLHTLIRQGEAGGIMREALFDDGIPYVEVAPSSLKAFATGNGRATKDEMIAAAVRQGTRGGITHDEADAWHARRMGRVARGIEPAGPSYEVEAINNSGVVWWP